MKNLLVAMSLVGMSMTTLGAPMMKTVAGTVKYDKKKNKKKGQKKVKHRKCEAYQG